MRYYPYVCLYEFWDSLVTSPVFTLTSSTSNTATGYRNRDNNRGNLKLLNTLIIDQGFLALLGLGLGTVP